MPSDARCQLGGHSSEQPHVWDRMTPVSVQQPSHSVAVTMYVLRELRPLLGEEPNLDQPDPNGSVSSSPVWVTQLRAGQSIPCRASQAGPVRPPHGARWR